MSTENTLPPTELIEGHPDNVLIKGGGCWNCGEDPALLVADEDDYRKLFEFAEQTWEQLQKAEGAGKAPPENPDRCPKCGEWPMTGDPHKCLTLPGIEAK